MAAVKSAWAALLLRAQNLRRQQPGLDADGYKRALQSGSDVAPAVAASPDFLAFAYASHARDDVNQFAVATCESRRSALNKLAEFWQWNNGRHPLPVAEFTESLIADFDAWLKREKGNNPTTRRKALDLLSLYIGRAIRRGVLPRHANPLEYYDLPKPTPTKTWLTDAEVSALEAVRLPPQQHLARTTYFIQYYLHGSRIGVVLRLKWKQRSHGTVRFKMDKGEVEKVVDESPQLSALLDSLRPAGGAAPDPEAFALAVCAIRAAEPREGFAGNEGGHGQGEHEPEAGRRQGRHHGHHLQPHLAPGAGQRRRRRDARPGPGAAAAGPHLALDNREVHPRPRLESGAGRRPAGLRPASDAHHRGRPGRGQVKRR